MVWEENEVKILGITINNELKFDRHISNICSKANKKLGYSLSFFFKHSLNIFLLYEGSIVDLPITKSKSFKKEL